MPNDLTIPALSDGEAAAGKRVKQAHPEWKETAVYHVLYLPDDWTREKKLPLIIEFPGNGGFTNKLGDVSTGKVEDCKLGLGLSGGRGMIWAVLPFVHQATKANQLNWWGDADATADYCVKTVRWLCETYGADPDAVILCGFSRGAIACSYIGLRNDEIARLWRGIFAHSHYDGVRKWVTADSDADSARKRLSRLNGRPQFISHESSVADTQKFLENSKLDAGATFVSLPFPNHTDTWVLKDLPERKQLREWLLGVLGKKK
ncbi:MAG TPA: hypothetical protein VEK08_10750 [Planctomycetota bacterium]|nr:hypothetical protein [Planctomycetota bacterium]